MNSQKIDRFTFSERVIHWVVGVSFVFLLLTGLAFSHPRLYWLTYLVGGGSSARALHPLAGILFSVSMVFMFFVWLKDMGLDSEDRKWLKAITHYIKHDRDKVPEAGKYNAGQKVFFWSMALLGVLYLITGVVMWQPDGFLGWGPFYGTIVNFMRLIHYLVTLAGALLLIVHVYLGTAAYPGTLGGMLHGSVTRSWAALHHPKWRRDKRSS